MEYLESAHITSTVCFIKLYSRVGTIAVVGGFDVGQGDIDNSSCAGNPVCDYKASRLLIGVNSIKSYHSQCICSISCRLKDLEDHGTDWSSKVHH